MSVISLCAFWLVSTFVSVLVCACLGVVLAWALACVVRYAREVFACVCPCLSVNVWVGVWSVCMCA